FVHSFYKEDSVLQTAKCKICIEKFKDTHGSTTDLRNYLKEHGINKLNYKNFLDKHNEVNTDETNDTGSSTEDSAEDSSSSSALLATILDSCLKGLQFVNQDEYISIQEKLLVKYEELRHATPLTQVSINLINQDEEDDTFASMWASGQEIIQAKKDEVSQYMNLPETLENEDPLTWWNDHKKTFPTLSSLACNYLGVSAISVPNERLFTNAGAREISIKAKVCKIIGGPYKEVTMEIDTQSDVTWISLGLFNFLNLEKIDFDEEVITGHGNAIISVHCITLLYIKINKIK
ncbi:5282_t:CDS:2, partial [Racocetra fulgida]